MKLSIIMPAYNEVSTIAEAIRRVLNAPVECVKELIIVDDCSMDGTRQYLANLVDSGESTGEDGAIKVLFHRA